MIAVTTMVWALPRSLATTWGITIVFFSSAYLDVSVRRVCLCSFLEGLPHSEIYGYNAYQRLPVAYRSWSRPS